MVVNKKIEKKAPMNDAMEYISQGGEVSADKSSDPVKVLWVTVCLRIPQELLKEVDWKVKKRAALTRTAWILEAIQQKLSSEKEEESE